MTALLNEQLDFIFFFYGFAFILLGTVCFAITRGQPGEKAWPALAMFGLLHGAAEWLDLTALVLGDAPLFAMGRIALMTVSFVFLLEFSRLHAVRFGWVVPRMWLHVPLLSLVIIGGVLGGSTVAGVIARYAIGLTGAGTASFVFAKQAGQMAGTARRFAVFAALGLGLYAIVAGGIVPTAPFWPASVFNYTWFIATAGLPVQLVRGLLACWIAYAVWAIWGRMLMSEVASDRYATYLRRQFHLTLAALTIVLMLGWMLTQFLGGIYKQNVQREAQGDINLLASHLAGETVSMDGMVKALAGSPTILPLLAGGSLQEQQRARLVLALDVEAAGARFGAILDRSGAVIVASDHTKESSNYSATAYFRKAMAGEPGYEFALDAADSSPDYVASYPIRLGNGTITGVAVLQKSLDAFQSDLAEFGRTYFFIDPDGVIMLTNRPRMLRKFLWPQAGEKIADGPLAGKANAPVMGQQIVDATWINVGGERDYVRRRFANHSRWSLVLVMTTAEIFASRVSGIVMTLLVTIMVLIYLFGRERLVRDNVQMDKRLQLQELAQNLLLQATTDPLTGLFNRLKFNEALANEMARSQRYDTPLSLILYDVDHFKYVNDTYGHPAGDKVLVKLSRLISDLIRTTDLHARWGGEEFVILAAGSDGQMAYQIAEKLRVAVEETVFEGVGRITCSFGVADYIEADTVETLVAMADSALYQAKTKGRNRVELATLMTTPGVRQMQPV